MVKIQLLTPDLISNHLEGDINLVRGLEKIASAKVE